MDLDSLDSNGLHSHQISIQSSTFRMRQKMEIHIMDAKLTNLQHMIVSCHYGPECLSILLNLYHKDLSSFNGREAPTWYLRGVTYKMAGGNASSSDSQELNVDQQKYNEGSAEMQDRVCSYEDVLTYLNLTKDNSRYIMSRPVKNYRTTTTVKLQMLIYAILDVREADQTFISYIWVHMLWENDYIMWNTSEFCGIPYIEVPAEVLWKPDLMIEEMIEKDKAPPSPFLCINADGTVELRNDVVVISTCKMHIYTFPFDIQTCNVSFKSVLYADDEINITEFENKTMATEWSFEAMRSKFEWMYLSQTITTKTVNYFGFNQSVIVYTIKMKRKSALYVANFLLPVLFFLCLDFASLLMSNGGDKISFKVTVLLAVTVMQLILNEILPATTNNIPLIVIYCIGSFGLMLLSLLETILINYLMEKDASQDGTEQSLNEERETNASIYEKLADQTSSVYKEGSGSQLTELFLAVEKVSAEIGVIKTCVLLSRNKEQETPGYWTSLANRINKVFTVFYIAAVTGFLCTLFFLWISTSQSE
ncbi:5-hydroxytryptamine receptor 3B-like [Nematolebias whitei]|uniref:5-hydroxytryptamine receptor 3B-like n=1 Tax=Nematolebias whitei TaxID=451745 RepID=UPI00189B15CD|nr:5-hydroxytryptamine receptor 3B-like [Nematolebias whitei]